jgi:hypothetical protein
MRIFALLAILIALSIGAIFHYHQPLISAQVYASSK